MFGLILTIRRRFFSSYVEYLTNLYLNLEPNESRQNHDRPEVVIDWFFASGLKAEPAHMT